MQNSWRCVSVEKHAVASELLYQKTIKLSFYLQSERNGHADEGVNSRGLSAPTKKPGNSDTAAGNWLRVPGQRLRTHGEAFLFISQWLLANIGPRGAEK